MNDNNAMLEKPYSAIVRALQEKRYADAEREAIRTIREAALLPQPWVLLAEALLHQGFGAAARRAFDRAWLLDPQASWVGSAYKALERSPAGPDRADIDQLLQYKRVSVSFGIIAYNEERCIARCLDSIRDIADEIVVVDCGSTDRTVQIAAACPKVRIVEVGWNDSFAELRNEGLKHMTADWVVWIDADEQLHPDDREAVHEAAGLYASLPLPSILYVWQMNAVGGAWMHDFTQTRMFPLHRGLRYYGRVHEQVGLEDEDLFAGKSLRKPVRIRFVHDGYEPQIVKAKDKLQRNLRLLSLMVGEEPDNPGWWLYYGRESLASGLVEQALHALAEAERTADDKPAFSRMLDVWMLQAKAYAVQADWSSVIRVCEKALQHSPDFPDAQFCLAQAKLKQGYALYKEAEELLRRSKTSFATYRGAVSPDHEIAKWKADVCIADIARSVGRFGDAAQIYERVAAAYPYVTQVKKPLQQIEEQMAKVRKLSLKKS